MDQSIQLRIRTEIYQPATNGRIALEDMLEIKADSFVELCRILGEFHDLADQIRSRQAV